MKKLLHRCTCVFLVLLVANMGCLRSVNAFTIGEEREIGEKLLFTVRSAFPLLDDPDIHQYINNLGAEVLEVSGVQFFDYHFFVIKNKEFNAFAAPSGLIFFHTGLIETMNSENELVSVLAHEIGHIVKRHLASRLEKGKIVNIATLGLALASLALGNAEATQALITGSLAAGQSLTLHFSRLDEEEADLLAYGWMKKLERNPEAQDRMLQTMRRITRYRMGQVPQYLLTHPNPEVRMDYVESLLAAEQNDIQLLTRDNRFDFLRFKYRVMSMVKTGSVFREYLASKIADSRSDKMDVIMAKYGIAQLDRLENDYPQSLELIEEVIQAFPEEPILQVDKGIVEYESGKIEKALETLLDAYNGNRRDLYAAFALAKVYFSKNNLARAEALFLEVVDGMPEYTKVYFELGKLMTQKRKTGDASYYLGKYYLYEGKHKLSVGSFKAAIDNDSTDENLKKKAAQSLEVLERIMEE